MRANILASIVLPRPISWFLFRCYIFAVAGMALIFFVGWVVPSLEGRTAQHIGADSPLYMDLARAITLRRVDPITAAALLHFPNNLWGPVLVALICHQSPALIALFNLVLLLISGWLLRKTTGAGKMFWVLLLITPTTMISILTVNKEILDLFDVSVFLFAYKRHHRGVLSLIVLVSALSRIELSAVMVIFLFLISAVNPLRSNRSKTLFLLLFAISLSFPILGRAQFAMRLQEASQTGSFVVFLDRMQMHFLYFIAFLPKLLQNLFGELVAPGKWARYSTDDLANTYVILMNNLCTLVILMVLIRKRTFSLRTDTTFLAAVGAMVMCLSFVIQPRYFYFVYALLCVDAARNLPRQTYRLRLPLHEI